MNPQTELEEVMICGEGIATFFLKGGLLDAVAAREPQAAEGKGKEKRLSVGLGPGLPAQFFFASSISFAIFLKA